MASRPKMDLDILRSLLQEGSFDVRYQDPQIEQHGDPRRWYEIRPYVPVLAGGALSLRNEDLAGQVDDLLLAFEAVIAAVDDGLPLDDAIVKVRKMWDLYGPSDTSLGEGAAEPAAPAPAEVIPPDEPWPTRTVADAAAIKLFRDQFSQSGYHGVGSMCMWLEEQLLAKSREVDALVEAVETCGPHIAAEILAKAGEVVAPKEAFNG